MCQVGEVVAGVGGEAEEHRELQVSQPSRLVAYRRLEMNISEVGLKD